MSSVVRFYVDSMETTSARRRLRALNGIATPADEDGRWTRKQRLLLEDLGSLQARMFQARITGFVGYGKGLRNTSYIMWPRFC